MGFFIDQQMWHQAAPDLALEGAIIKSAAQLWSLGQDNIKSETCWTFEAWVGADLNTLIHSSFEFCRQISNSLRLISHLLQIVGVLGKSRLHAGKDLVHLIRRVHVPKEVKCSPYQIYSNISNIVHILNILMVWGLIIVHIWPNIAHIWCWLS